MHTYSILLCQDQSTVAQQAETTVAEHFLTSCMWAHFPIDSPTVGGKTVAVKQGTLGVSTCPAVVVVAGVKCDNTLLWKFTPLDIIASRATLTLASIMALSVWLLLDGGWRSNDSDSASALPFNCADSWREGGGMCDLHNVSPIFRHQITFKAPEPCSRKKRWGAGWENGIPWPWDMWSPTENVFLNLLINLKIIFLEVHHYD